MDCKLKGLVLIWKQWQGKCFAFQRLRRKEGVLRSLTAMQNIFVYHFNKRLSNVFRRTGWRHAVSDRSAEHTILLFQ
jgi:hypothetical protein